MNNTEHCLQNKIAALNNKLQPTIFNAILKLYKKGFIQITAQMVIQECIKIEVNINWNQRLKAICNAMRNVTKCGARIAGEDRDFNNFNITFDGKVTNLDIKNPKKTLNMENKNIPTKPNHNNDIIDLDKLKLSKNFKVVMACAGGKNDSKFTQYPKVNFVATPNLVNEFRPDDICPLENIAWRLYLIENQNDSNLLKAYLLYKRNEYQILYNKFKSSFFILSAGWGLVNSEFKLPKYDITFSTTTQPKSKRNIKLISQPMYHDFNQLTVEVEDDIVFLGGKDYRNLFYKLIQNLPNRKVIFYKGQLPILPRWVINRSTFTFVRYVPYNPNNNYGWYYELGVRI